jgi:hypothetical protein
MTTKSAEAQYLREHLAQWKEKGYAVYNPENRPIEDLPVIYGFNNGGSPGWMYACLLAEDGEGLGSHICSHEGYMPHDLGVIEGSRPDRHEDFAKHYPQGYRMDFLGYDEVRSHAGLREALEKNKVKAAEAEALNLDATP